VHIEIYCQVNSRLAAFSANVLAINLIFIRFMTTFPCIHVSFEALNLSRVNLKSMYKNTSLSILKSKTFILHGAIDTWTKTSQPSCGCRRINRKSCNAKSCLTSSNMWLKKTEAEVLSKTTPPQKFSNLKEILKYRFGHSTCLVASSTVRFVNAQKSLK